MPDPSTLRDSTQIVLSNEAIEGLEGQLDDEFVLTILDEDGRFRLVGSPVEIKAASEYLVRHGISLR